MKHALGILLLGLLIGLNGCSAAKPAGGGTEGSTGAATEIPPVQQTPMDAENASVPAPPEGARYTLLCNVFNGPTHIADASQAKETLIKSTGLKDFYVVHSESESDLYFGYYKTFDDRSQPDEYQRAQSDHARIASLTADNGEHLFGEVVFTSINTPDPVAPKEWDLSSNKGYWTLQIAVYRDNPLRKQYAVDAVRSFRKAGVEAYYRHGVSTSEVYIGSWPKNAIAQQDSSDASSQDPNQPILVLPGPVPGHENSDFYTPDGRKMKVMMPKVELVDPSLRKVALEYPNYFVNGEVVGRKVKNPDNTTSTIPWPSYLIQVPHENDSGETTPDPNANPDTAQTGGTGGTGGTDADNGPTSTIPGLGGLAK